MYDLIIRNGTLVDGTGRAACNADLAISEGRIAAVGQVEGEAAREIDAGGQLVTPGWVDTHSHMDGQATWDHYLSPALNHGITTLVMGNCGVGFAPCQPNDEAHDLMISVMEDVEDIPGSALDEEVREGPESRALAVETSSAADEDSPAPCGTSPRIARSKPGRSIPRRCSCSHTAQG